MVRNQEPKVKKTIAIAAALLLHAVAAPATTAQPLPIDGEVTKIDAAQNKITLRHGPIKKLDMDEGMTMVFRVKDPALLKQVKVGDKVKFDAEHAGGQYIVTRMQKAK
jgi:Cu(I)/Ag(I) efflux system periplasmic protein CusF